MFGLIPSVIRTVATTQVNRNYLLFFIREVIHENRSFIIQAICYVLRVCCFKYRLLLTVSYIQVFGYIPEELHCDNIEVASTGPWKVILQVSLILYAFGPVVLTVLLYVWMMFFAMTKAEPTRTASGRYQIKGGGGAQMRGPNKALQTVSMIVGIYLISISLTIAVIVVRIGMPDAVPKRVHLAATCLWLLNTAVNPIIYVYNNPMFRSHVKRLIMRKRGVYSTNSSVAASVKRRVTQQSVINVMPSPVGLQSRRENHVTMQRSATAVSLMNLTPVAGRRSLATDMHVVAEESPRVELDCVSEAVIFKNQAAETDIPSPETVSCNNENGESSI